jgi:putative phage-type endonuclease
MSYTVLCDATDRAAWLKYRREGVTGTDAARILGLSPWGGQLDVVADKVGLEEDDVAPSESAEWGRILQPAIIEEYGNRTGRGVREWEELLQCKDRPWQLMTPDAEQCEVIGSSKGLLEIKVTGLRDRWNDGVPPDVFAQVQHGLAVTGYDWATVAVLFSGRGMELDWIEVERDATFIAAMNEREGQFWDRLQRGEYPEDNGDVSARKALARLWPQDTGEEVVLPGALVSVDEILVEHKEHRKKLDERIGQLEDKIRVALQDATQGVLPNGVTYRNKLVKRKAYEVKASEFRQLRRLEAKG